MKPATRYLLIAAAVLFGVGLLQQEGCELPIDIPTPGPTAGEVWAVLIEETGDREPWLGQLIVQMQNANLAPHEFKSFDDDQLPEWATFPDVTARPSLVFINAQTKEKLSTMLVPKGTTPEQVKEWTVANAD